MGKNHRAQRAANVPKEPQQKRTLTEVEKVAGIVSIATAGGTPKDVADFAGEWSISTDLVRKTADGLEDNARKLQMAVQILEPAHDDEDSDEP